MPMLIWWDIPGNRGSRFRVEAVDVASKKLWKQCWLGGAAFVTADHGNAEQMTDESGKHPLLPTHQTPYLVFVSSTPYSLGDQGILADIAPTILDLLELSQTAGDDGKILLMRWE